MYLEIIDYVYDSSDWDRKDRKHTLSSLLQTCCLFRAFLAPRIFKSLHFNGGQDASESDNPVNPAAFCRALNNQREPAVSLAKHVQECTIADWQSDSDPSTQAIKTSFLDMYCRSLRRLPNLQDLVLCRVLVDDRILKTLGKLSSLNHLRLDNVDFCLTILAADAFTWKKTSPIRTLDWRMNIFTGPDDIDVDKRAAVVTALVDTAELQYLIGSNSAQILPFLSQSPPLLSLTIGALHSTRSFWEALGGIVTLETLTIRIAVFLSEEFSNHQYLPISSLPKLQNLSIPPSLCSLAAQRRIVHLDMVHSVETDQIWGGAFVPLTLTSLPIDHFKNISRITGGIISLQVPLEFFLAGPLCERLPSIQHLGIKEGHDNNSARSDAKRGEGSSFWKSFVEKVSTKWSPALSVTSLTLDLFPSGRRITDVVCTECSYDLELQRELVLNLLVGFPNVTKLEFFAYIVWKQTAERAEWRCSVPSIFEDDVRRDLSTGRYVVKDVDGILRPFLLASDS
ncbi:hypothetical protein H0H93_007103 [Arthromyces matolae]|nr:hypothetical protein H0H93_007103 [Arthromyces matolae]